MIRNPLARLQLLPLDNLLKRTPSVSSGYAKREVQGANERNLNDLNVHVARLDNSRGAAFKYPLRPSRLKATRQARAQCKRVARSYLAPIAYCPRDTAREPDHVCRHDGALRHDERGDRKKRGNAY
jgi:hypothetical protein